MSSEDTIKCEMCGKETPEEEVNWVMGNPYCDSCKREAERLYGDF